ncbi:MAG TPA: hypothetical protein VGK54_17355, partial [Chloroflexota bacterium]
GALALPTALIVLALFVAFLLLQAFLGVTKRAAPCGCRGPAPLGVVDGWDITASALLVLVAAFHLGGRWPPARLRSNCGWQAPLSGALRAFGFAPAW